ncbi:hypothetical protein WR25_23222 [Diploscapter pachys]|uniref:Uncharacterized protein n=1 Tax=Diploscapter pachys TaxID=2018661 RepID=A0A2A2JK28_9BILA|nr:hypothetical protein WR25_23222 [Diploscapter pachys]
MSRQATHHQCYDVHVKLERIRNCLKEKHSVLILMRGAPGSGKSHLAKSLLKEYSHGRIFSTDDLFTNKHGVYKFEPMKLEEYHKKNQILGKILETKSFFQIFGVF